MRSALILQREKCHIHIQVGTSTMDMLEGQDMWGLLFSFDAVRISLTFLLVCPPTYVLLVNMWTVQNIVPGDWRTI